MKKFVMTIISTISSFIHPQCSLDQVASTIEKYYYGLVDMFSNLTESRMRDIQNQIRTRLYTLSSFQLVLKKNKDPIPGYTCMLLHLSIDNQFVYGYLISNQEDQLVLMALGDVINTRILNLNLQHSSSFGFKVLPTDYYKHICSIERAVVSRVYKLDMSNTLKIMNKKSILTMLQPIVSNDEIMELLRSWNYIQVLHEGEDVSYLIEDIVPHSSLITDILLNFYFIELDHQFHQVFPSFSYTRYMNEILITTPQSVPFFESSLLALLGSLELDAKIVSIGPGDPPLPCHHGALISLTEDGRLFLM